LLVSNNREFINNVVTGTPMFETDMLFIMRAIAERRTAGFFATAQINRFGFFRSEFHRCKFRALMRAIAERLAFAMATGAPEIGFSLFDLNGIRTVLWACWF